MAASSDDFDQWVSGRIQSGPGGALRPLATLLRGLRLHIRASATCIRFGGWYAVDGFGYCWRPYGVSAGWNPFQFGNWFF